MNKVSVYARLPRAGLGNKLLVWARARVYAHQNGFKFYVSNWSEMKFGPLLRFEKRKRLYWGYFSKKNYASFLTQLSFKFFYNRIFETEALNEHCFEQRRNVVIFHRTPSWDDYFAELRGHEAFIKKELVSVVSPKYLVNINLQKKPVIAVHIRRSDFAVPQGQNILGSTENLRTPIKYYIDVIQLLRKFSDEDLEVTIFTDGSKSEISEILLLPNVQISEKNSDIVDLLLMSMAQCIVVSTGSTFSYWAAFISNAHVITHPAHDVKIRSRETREIRYEGPATEGSINDPLFVKCIKNLRTNAIKNNGY